MGPQFYRCGNAEQDALHTDDMAASMGPQLYRCGNRHATRGIGGSLQGFNGAATLSLRKLEQGHASIVRGGMLQWGRNFIVVETGLEDWITPKQAALQWGRNFIVAEMMRRRLHYTALRFNGAATLSLRKYS